MIFKGQGNFQDGNFLQITIKSGKAVKNSGKGKKKKTPWKRKGKGKLSVLPEHSEDYEWNLVNSRKQHQTN